MQKSCYVNKVVLIAIFSAGLALSGADFSIIERGPNHRVLRMSVPGPNGQQPAKEWWISWLQLRG